MGTFILHVIIQIALVLLAYREVGGGFALVLGMHLLITTGVTISTGKQLVIANKRIDNLWCAIGTLVQDTSK